MLDGVEDKVLPYAELKVEKPDAVVDKDPAALEEMVGELDSPDVTAIEALLDPALDAETDKLIDCEMLAEIEDRRLL